MDKIVKKQVNKAEKEAEKWPSNMSFQWNDIRRHYQIWVYFTVEGQRVCRTFYAGAKNYNFKEDFTMARSAAFSFNNEYQRCEEENEPFEATFIDGWKGPKSYSKAYRLRHAHRNKTGRRRFFTAS